MKEVKSIGQSKTWKLWTIDYFIYFQIFADLRSKNVKIIIADFYMPAARAVMCEAYRQVNIEISHVW